MRYCRGQQIKVILSQSHLILSLLLNQGHQAEVNVFLYIIHIIENVERIRKKGRRRIHLNS